MVFCSFYSLLGLLHAHTHPETRIIHDPGLFHLLKFNDTALQWSFHQLTVERIYRLGVLISP
jgi:hypothetical protein